MNVRVIYWFAFLLLPTYLFSTHIVGGELNYTYNGGSSYTIRLKLYRDCGAGTASLPNSVSITVKGLNGASFSPSKDFTMPLVSVTNVPSNQPPCAVPPNPSPCTQVGTYTITVNNLPANVGGYHLYYQVVARNLSLTNINAACNCVGESFYARIPDNTNAALNNSNAVFTNLPPLYLCVGQPFSFNHSATDANGDSLVYSLYTPYNGDNGVGPLDPTFPSNTASFTPVSYVAGFTTNNPLGPGPFSLNSSTGILSGTPAMIGQFVVGVMVKEYRNGVFISETLRDFQFNVINCPAPPPSLAVPNFTLNNGCVKTFSAGGITAASANWTSVYPGAMGAYNSYLACTSGCLNNTITAGAGAPPYVDYKICGTSTNCAATNICDTFRVYFNSTLSVSIVPNNPILCYAQNSTTLVAIGSGGTPPYSYLWNNVNPSQTITVGNGVYNVALSDASGCPAVYQSVTVTSYTAPITANAGPNITKCIQSPTATLSGSVAGAMGGVWSGGTGTYSPNNATLNNLNYIPTPAEIATGSVSLILTTTGNGVCPAGKDTVNIYFVGFTGTVSTAGTPVSCFGGSNGTATVSVAGGMSPYQYTWSTVPAQTGSVVNNLSLGIYSVTITNSIGCTSAGTVSITQPLPLSINSTVTNVSCYGTASGSISAGAAGGTGPYSFIWAPGNQTSTAITNIAIGNYTLTVTDSKSCQATSVFSVTQPASLTITSTVTNVSCFGGGNGAVNTGVAGGTPPFTYSWMPSGATTSSVSNLTAGNYTVLVTDNKGCIATRSLTVTQPTLIAMSFSVSNETCDYLNNGSATLNVTGGTPSYSYLWVPGNFTNSAVSNLSSGSYTATVTDANSCSSYSVIAITQPPTLIAGIINQVNVSCFGGSNGSVTANPTGGTPAYSYTWLPGAVNNPTANNLSAGMYTLTVSDTKSCIASTTVSITQPLPLTVTSTISNVSCNGGSNGSISLTPGGGTLPYSFFWQPGGQSTSSVSNLTAGVYTANITDLKGCILSATYTVTQPSSITIAITSTNVSCFGGNNGIANSTVTGGTAPYTYSWNPGGAASANATNLSSGIYTLSVLDGHNCPASATVSITQPTVLSVITSAVNETCDYLNNGSATSTVSGGTPAYSYLWQPGGLTSSGISNLSSGSYSLTVTDSKGCSVNTVVVITQPAPLVVSFTNQINVSCSGGNNGSALAVGSGGTPNYSYTWTPSGINNALANNLTAGVYTITVSDLHTCVATNTISITQPLPLNVNISYTNVVCNGGSSGAIIVSGSGGSAPYSHTLMPVNIVGLNFAGLPSGTYTILTQDANGCTASNTVNLSQPVNFSSATNFTNSTCLMQNGVASVSVASGGTPPFTYSWSPSGGTSAVSTPLFAGSYTVAVTDANGCISSNIVNINDVGGPVVSIVSVTNVSCYGGSNAAATASFSGGTGPNYTFSWSPTGGNSLTATGLSAGLYVIHVVDNAGCIGLATTPLITQPASLSLTYSSTPVSCFGGTNGSATVAALGGTPAYTYSWIPGLGTGPSVSGLTAGNYSVKVTDVNSCTLSTTFTITQPPLPLSISVVSGSVSCFGGTNGSASSTVSGGTAPYNFVWSPGNISSQNISNLSAGNYALNVTDNKGCAISNTVSVIQPASITIISGGVNSNCGLANGQASVSVSGGMGSYIYSWTPTGGTNNIANNLASGVYTITVSDANTCLAFATQTVVNNPAPLVAVTGVTNVSCFSGSDASASASVTGGTGPFTYTWLPAGGSNLLATGLPIGTYTVYVTAVNGCTAAAVSPFITQPTQVLVNTYTTQVSCFGGTNGSASVAAGGGTPPYTYTWLPSASNNTVISNLSAGVYTVIAADSKNCTQSLLFTIGQPSAISINSVSAMNVSCFGGNNGSATIVASGGIPAYNYTWSPSVSNGSLAMNLTAGTYTAYVYDANGCNTSTTVNITQPLQALTATALSSSVNCFGAANGSGTVNVSGGTAGYTYQWSPNISVTNTGSALATGGYNILVTDINSCTTSVSFSVTQPSQITGSMQVTNPSCNLLNGAVQAQISGGTGPYSYSWTPANPAQAMINGLGPGTYSLQVTDASGCLSNYSTSLVNIPGPTVNSTPIASVTCYGNNNGSASVSISMGTSPYQISWLPYGGSASTAGSLTAGIYTAQVTDALNCISTTTVQIIQPSLLSVSIPSVNNVSCYLGNDGSILASLSGGTPVYSYTWLPAGNSASISNLGIGTYTLIGSDANNCTVSITSQISQPPVLTSSITNISNAVCNGSTGNATLQVSGGTAPYTYSWSSTPVQSGGVLIGVPAGNYNVSITDAKGCTASNSVTITQPNPVQTFVSSHDTICKLQNVVLTASASGGAGNYYYSWQPINVTNSGTLSQSPIVNTTYTVMAFDQNGCGGNPVTSDIVVYEFDKANLVVTGISPICPGEVSIIAANVTGNTGAVTYTWNQGLGNTPGPLLVTPTVQTVYVIQVSNSCGKTISDSITVAINSQPTISISSNAKAMCLPATVNFNDLSVSGNPNDPITSWSWNFGNGQISSSSNPVITFTSGGTYSVSLTAQTDAGCINQNTATPYVVTIYDKPLAAFTVNSTYLNLPMDKLVCTNMSQRADSYQWSFGDNSYTSDANPVHTYTTLGMQMVELIAMNKDGCSDTAYIQIETNADVIFPNAFTPAGNSSGYYNVNSLDNNVFFPYTSGVLQYKLQIFSRWGELLFESEDVNYGWDGKYRGELCMEGVYIWKAYVKLSNGKVFNRTGDVTLLK